MSEGTEATVADPEPIRVQSTRQKILLLCSKAGDIARSLVISEGEYIQRDISAPVVDIVRLLVEVAILMNIDLNDACLRKLKLNHAKYPLRLCGKEVRQRSLRHFRIAKIITN